MEWQEIEIPRGDYRELDFKIIDEDGNPVHLSGKSFRVSMKQSLSDDDSAAIFTKTSWGSDDIIVYDAENGIVKVILWPQDTRIEPGMYYLELKMYEGQKVLTVSNAKVKIAQVVWRGDS